MHITRKSLIPPGYLYFTLLSYLVFLVACNIDIAKLSESNKRKLGGKIV